MGQSEVPKSKLYVILAFNPIKGCLFQKNSLSNKTIHNKKYFGIF